LTNYADRSCVVVPRGAALTPNAATVSRRGAMSASKSTIILAPPDPKNPFFDRKTVTETDYKTANPNREINEPRP
jgi:hypothetical protein